MKILTPEFDLEAFYRELRHARHKALLLDYDGTLSPFQVKRHQAFPYPGVPQVLNEIMQSPDIRLVIISGRWIKDLLPLLQMEEQPEIWGSHGLERLKRDGSYEIAPMNESSLSGLVTADEWIEAKGLSHLSEKKPGCLVIHWRGLENEKIREIKGLIKPKWTLISAGAGLSLKEFDGGLELRVPARNKGDAVQTVFTEIGRNALAAYLGDDATDEDAFKAVKGEGIGVLVRKELRPTAADIWITPPEELLEFLYRWL